MDSEALKAIDANVAAVHNPFGKESTNVPLGRKVLVSRQGRDHVFRWLLRLLSRSQIARATRGNLEGRRLLMAYLGEDEWCCGDPQLMDGNIQLAEEWCSTTSEALRPPA